MIKLPFGWILVRAEKAELLNALMEKIGLVGVRLLIEGKFHIRRNPARCKGE